MRTRKRPGIFWIRKETGTGKALAELKNSKCLDSTKGIKSLKICGRESGREFSAKEKETGSGKALAELKNSKCLDSTKGIKSLKICGRESGREFSAKEKETGTGKALAELKWRKK